MGQKVISRFWWESGVISCQLIYFTAVVERTWWPCLVRLIALLVSVAWPFHLSVDWERVASHWLLVCCV